MTISKHYKLGKTQKDLAFADVSIIDDTPKFIDPWLIKDLNSNFGRHATNLVQSYFSEVLKAINEGNKDRAMQLLSHLHEVNWTRLGYSSKGARGKAIADEHAGQIYTALKESRAVKTKILKDLEDTALLIRGIGKDKISDMITNIIMSELIQFTNEQAALHGIDQFTINKTCHFWDSGTKKWVRSGSFKLPMHNGKPLLLVPEIIVNDELAVNSGDFYYKYILTYEQDRHLNNPSLGLCRLLKSGERRPPSKKELKLLVPKTNEQIIKYVNEHSELLAQYKNDLKGKRTVKKRRKPKNFGS